MRIGFSLPQIGPSAGSKALIKVAKAAEKMGYDSLWVLDRILHPVEPRTPYPASRDGSLPAQYQRVLDPIGTLTFVAGCTRRIALGTSVLVLPFYNPVLLARQLTSLDVLSEGRLRVGFGLGWSVDEYEAAGVPMKSRGKRADEFIQVLKKIWTEDPVEFNGEYFKVPRSIIGLKPVQKPHPPVYMSAYAPDALRRTALFADGWNPVGIPVPGMKQMFDAVKAMAAQAGRDPGKLELIVRANLEITPTPLGPERPIFTGTLDQIRSDVEATRELGASELIYGLLLPPREDKPTRMLKHMETLLSITQKI